MPYWIYNLYVTLYNRFVGRWNHDATEEPEDALIPTDLYNEQIEAYNAHVDAWNNDRGETGNSQKERV